MLPFLLTPAPDPWDILVKAGGWVIATLAVAIAGMVWRDFSELKKKVDALEKSSDSKHHALDLRVTTVELTSKNNEKRLDDLKETALTRDVFEERSDAQDARLETIDNKVTALDYSKASRSEMRAIERAPTRRTDGPGSAPSTPPPPLPPMRPRLGSSRGR